MRIGTRRRTGRAVLALLAGLLAGAWVGGGLVWVFNRTKLLEANGKVADVSLAPADELDAVPADAVGFAHLRAADLWKTDSMGEYRRLIEKVTGDSMKAFDDSFVPAPSTLDRVTVVAMARPNLAPPGPPVKIAPPALGKNGELLPPKGPPPPPPPPPETDAVALLTFTTPFDLKKVRESNLPKGHVVNAADTEVWADDASGVGIAARGDRTLIVGPAAAVRTFLLKPKTPTGPLAPALKLAAGGTRHVVAGLNLRAFMLPPDLAKQVPSEAGPVLRADSLTLGVVVGRGMRFDVRATYKDAETATEAEKALQKSADTARKSLAEAKKKMTEAAVGKAGGPKPRPIGDLPEAIVGLLSLGAVETADDRLARLPVTRDGTELSATMTVDSVGGAYAAVAAASVGFLLPAVQQVRDAAGRAQESNNLKQLALAMHNHHDISGRLPAAGLTAPPNTPRARQLLSWRVQILPYVGENALYQEFKLNEPWDGPNNIRLLGKMPRVFASPRAPAGPGKTHYQVFVTSDAAPVKTMFGRTVGRSLLVPDGTSNTIMIVEAADPVDWTKPEDLSFDPDDELPRLGLPGAPGFHAALGDGSVRFFPHTTRPQTLRIWIGGNDGIPNPPD